MAGSVAPSLPFLHHPGMAMGLPTLLPFPLNCCSGNVDPAHPIFCDPDIGPVIVATTSRGRERLVARMGTLGCVLEKPQHQLPEAATAANGSGQGVAVSISGAASGEGCGTCGIEKEVWTCGVEKEVWTCGVETEVYASPGPKPPLIRIKIAVIPEAASAGATGGADTAARGGGSKDGFRAELQADEACTKDGSSLSGSVIPLVAASSASI